MILQKKYSIHYLNITKLIWNQSEPELTLFSQENVYDLYTEVASYMTWINSTIMKMHMDFHDLFMFFNFILNMSEVKFMS